MDTKNPGFETLSKVFFDADAARELLESIRWPNGPVCAHCDSADRVYPLKPREGSTRPVREGVYKCGACRKQFTVTVGTIFESTRVPLNKWLYAIHLMTRAKKGVSAHQIHRTIQVTYKTAWFMCHRVRKAMETGPLSAMFSGIVEADETYVGGKRRPGRKGTEKAIVFGMVERGGKAKTQVVGEATADTLQGAILDDVDPTAFMMTDGLLSYVGLDEIFSGHSPVDHNKHYVNGNVHTNTAASMLSLIKRGILGTFHHASIRSKERPRKEKGPGSFLTWAVSARTSRPESEIATRASSIGARGSIPRIVSAMLRIVVSDTIWPTIPPRGSTPTSTTPPSPFNIAQRVSPTLAADR